MISEPNRRVLKWLHDSFHSESGPTHDFWTFLMMCFSTPRPSTNYDGINKEERTIPFRRVCSEVCGAHGLTYLEDAAGNIIVKNFNAEKTQAKFCFQGHMDVVVSKNASVVHDFETEGVDVRITDEGTLKPVKGITLGADNGVAIACGFAILVNNKDVPLELLITKNEETSFDGACGLDATMLSATTLLNLDSEVEKMICVGSAGGFEQHFKLAMEHDPSCHNPLFQIRLFDFKGGHSGIDIDKEKVNANMALARLLLSDSNSIQIVELRGGTSTNAIPREAFATIACDPTEVQGIRKRFEDFAKETYAAEPDAKLDIEAICREDSSKGNVPMTVECTKKLIGLILATGTGVVRKLKGDVESSFNLGLLLTESNNFVLKYLIRSTSVSWMRFFANQLSLIGKSFGAEVLDSQGFFGAWEPQYNSKIVDNLIKSHPDPHAKVKTYTVHAGLECSTILERFAMIGRTDVECASIGPQIENAHSPDECLDIKSAVEFVRWVDNLVKRV